jgi:hypothetical protein
MVYSTCTFNPIEDEAVVAEVLRRTKGSMKLIDVSSQLPALKRQKGLLTWKVKDKTGWYSNWEEGKSGFKLDPSMFPGDDNESLGLEHCMRYLPHHQNTGGFFVCVLEKVAPLENLKYPTLEHRGPSKWDKKKEGDKPVEKQSGDAAAAAGEGGEGSAEPFAATNDAVVVVKVEKAKPKPPPKVLPEWGVRGGGARDLGSMRAAENATLSANQAGNASAADPQAEQKHHPNQRGTARWRGIDPIVPFSDKAEIEAIRVAYGLGPACVMPDSLVSRSTDPRPKRLSYISPGCKLLLRMDAKEQLKVTAGGLKMFERQENKEKLLTTCYRISQEGLPNLLPHMTRQRFQPTVEEFIKVLNERAVGLPDEVKVHITKKVGGDDEVLAPAADPAVQVKKEEEGAPAEDAMEVVAAEAPAAAAAATEVKKEEGDTADVVAPARNRFKFHDPSTLKQLAAVEYGCCVATLRAEDVAALDLAGEGDAEGGLASNAPIAIVCWRGRGTLNVLVSKQECAQLADRLETAVAAKKAAKGGAK